MPRDNEFAWTGPMPAAGGYVGFVNLTIEDDGVLFTVRSEGAGESRSYKVPFDVADTMFSQAQDALAKRWAAKLG